MRNIPNVSGYLFWDVDPQQVDWQAEESMAWILKRVVERGGNKEDFLALVGFYGMDQLRRVGRRLTDFRFPQSKEILAQLLNLRPDELLCYTEKRSRAERLLSLKN